MRKNFHFLGLAMLSLALCMPAQAGRVYEARTFNDVWSMLGHGIVPGTGVSLLSEDTIRLMTSVTYSPAVTNNRYLFVGVDAVRHLDLNGCRLEQDPVYDDYKWGIEMNSGSELNIYDSRGGGELINNSKHNFVINCKSIGEEIGMCNGSQRINSACFYNRTSMTGLGTYEAAEDWTVNIYGGSIVAKNQGSVDEQCSVVVAQGSLVEANGNYKGGDVYKDCNAHVNIYGGRVSGLRSNVFTQYTYEEDYETYHAMWTQHQNVDGWEDIYLHKFLRYYYMNQYTLNLYGGEIGEAGMSFPALVYPKDFRGTLQSGTVYGIESEDHLNNFSGVGSGVRVYMNGTPTTVNSLKNSDLSGATVGFAYEPELYVSGMEVSRDNCDDILSWEEFKASFDYSTNTLYLKTLAPQNQNVLSGITFNGFDLHIVVDGLWRVNGSIVGTDGDLRIAAAHYALEEDDGDLLVVVPGNATAIQLSGHQLVLSNRVRLICYNNEQNTTPQSAVQCHDMWVNNSWFDAWGINPVVDCAYGSVVNATIHVGSFRNNDVIQVKPNIRQYVVWTDVYDDHAGGVTGDGLINEGVAHTVRATANSGYHFLRWSDGTSDNPYTFVVTQDTVLYALFEADAVINYYDITVVSENETMGSVSGGGTHIQQGQTVNISATPNAGYEFMYWTTANGQIQGRISQWTATADETLTAHFRVQPAADAYMLWVCGTQVTGSNSADILGDGVWNYDDATRTLTVMKDATYTISNDEFINDGGGGGSTQPLIVNASNHSVEVTCTTTGSTIRNAIVGTRGITFTGSAFHGITVTAQNMYVANLSKPLTVTGHMNLTLNLKNTTDFGRNNVKTAVLLSSQTPSLVVDGANLWITSGVGESAGAGYKTTNKTDQATHLGLHNAYVMDGSMTSRALFISDDSPQYEINYITPSLESLCLTSVFGLSFYEGTYVDLRAYPATGYKFVRWSDGNTDNPRLIIMPAENLYLDPIVEIDNSLTPRGAIVNANATEGQGAIVDFINGWFAEGAELKITAEPADGYYFVQWSDGHTANPYFLTVENGKNINITALFSDQEPQDVIRPAGDSNLINARKYIRSGALFIERNGKVYNAQGARVK